MSRLTDSDTDAEQGNDGDGAMRPLKSRHGSELAINAGPTARTSMDTHDAVASFRAAQSGYLPGHVGLDWSEIRQGLVRGHFEVGRQHLAPNGYLHAAAVVALADTACGYGCIASLPEGANGFTTVELKANFIGTALEGIVGCEARLVHGGRMTQVWDAEVKSEMSGKTIALFRCTQMLLTRPRGAQQPWGNGARPEGAERLP